MGAVEFASSRLWTPSSPAFVSRFRSRAESGTECRPRELRGPMPTPFPAPAQFKLRTPPAVLHVPHG
eukprot:2901840-Alexandrium_andersonii.AAC.1